MLQLVGELGISRSSLGSYTLLSLVASIRAPMTKTDFLLNSGTVGYLAIHKTYELLTDYNNPHVWY